MNQSQQRAELHKKIWKIAEDVRGAFDGWDFKQYILCTLFYRFISEDFAEYMQGDDDSLDYASLSDEHIDQLGIKDDAIQTKGYFIYPSQLFVNVVKNAPTNPNLNIELKEIFNAIEASAQGYGSEDDLKGIFDDFDTSDNRLGNSVIERNRRLTAILTNIAELKFNGFADSKIDLFGDAYEYLISNYAANAGKSSGEFFTPLSVSKLLARLALHGQTRINKIYDPACGSGALLLQAKQQFDQHQIEEGFFGQEINYTIYTLARMNMFLHGINYEQFNLTLGDTLLNPQLKDQRPFDAIVSNPPYSIKWIGDNDPTLINDDRFAPAGILAPKSKADFAFILHSLNYLSAKGRAAIVCFPGIFYRGGAERKIRQYLIENNFVESVIALAPNLFFGTSIAVNLLTLSKHKTNNDILFIDASDQYSAQTNNNELNDQHIQTILNLFANPQSVEHQSRYVAREEIAANDYNLSVSSYVAAKDTREIIDINQLNADIAKSVANIDALRKQIDAIIAEIE